MKLLKYNIKPNIYPVSLIIDIIFVICDSQKSLMLIVL